MDADEAPEQDGEGAEGLFADGLLGSSGGGMFATFLQTLHAAPDHPLVATFEGLVCPAPRAAPVDPVQLQAHARGPTPPPEDRPSVQRPGGSQAAWPGHPAKAPTTLSDRPSDPRSSGGHSSSLFAPLGAVSCPQATLSLASEPPSPQHSGPLGPIVRSSPGGSAAAAAALGPGAKAAQKATRAPGPSATSPAQAATQSCPSLLALHGNSGLLVAAPPSLLQRQGSAVKPSPSLLLEQRPHALMRTGHPLLSRSSASSSGVAAPAPYLAPLQAGGGALASVLANARWLQAGAEQDAEAGAPRRMSLDRGAGRGGALRSALQLPTGDATPPPGGQQEQPRPPSRGSRHPITFSIDGGKMRLASGGALRPTSPTLQLASKPTGLLSGGSASTPGRGPLLLSTAGSTASGVASSPLLSRAPTSGFPSPPSSSVLPPIRGAVPSMR